MAKKQEMEEMPSLFDDAGIVVEPVAPKKKILIPTKEEVNALAKRTGESPRKCYFWLLTEKNKEPVNE